MSDMLFTLTPSYPPRLLMARRRAEAAERAYDKAVESDELYDGFGIVPNEIRQERDNARRELFRAEHEAFYRKSR